MDTKKTLEELIATILVAMNEHYSTETCRQYHDVYNRLLKLVASRGGNFYSKELGQIFIADNNYQERVEIFHCFLLKILQHRNLYKMLFAF